MILSSVLPTCTKCASLRLNNVGELCCRTLQNVPHEGTAHRLANGLPTVRTILGVLDDLVSSEETPLPCEKI